jgi:hypothetical protein
MRNSDARDRLLPKRTWRQDPMSGSLPNLSGNPSIAAGNRAAPLQKRRGCGCFSSISCALLLVVVVMLIIKPWSVHIGGRWTPALTWHGRGKLQSTTGASYDLFMEVSVAMERKSRLDLTGTAKICTPQHEVYPVAVQGYLKDAWLDVDGKQATFYLRNAKDVKPRINFTLVGAWQGQQLNLDDKSSMEMSFATDGRAKGYLVGSNSPAQTTTGSLHYASEAEFTAACGAKNGNSF